MKKVDYEHFSRFAMPYSIKAQGNDLYFCVKNALLEEDKYKSDLYVLRDGAVRQLTSSGDVSDFRLLPEGIAFASLRDKKDKEKSEKGVPLSVWQVLPYDGGEATEFLRLDHRITDIRFLSRDRFFFTADYSHEFARVLGDCEGDMEKAAARMKEDSDYQVIDEIPFWFNGAGFINKTRNRLYIYENGQARALTDEFAVVNICSLSQDGSVLYYSCQRYEDMEYPRNCLFELDTSTLEARDISLFEGADHYGATALPEGRVAAFINTQEKHGLNQNPKVYLREGGEYRLLLGDGLHALHSSVGSDIKAGGSHSEADMLLGGGLHFIDTQGGSSQIIRLDLATGEVSNVTLKSGNISAATVFGDGFAMVAMRGGEGCELYSLDANGNERRLTELNRALCEEYEYSAPQRISFTDEAGDEIEGWVIAPVDAEAGKKYPTILDVHGGPKTAFGDCYFHEMQLWAGRGFAVMLCNPTGSDGGGDEFADIRGQYGQRDYRDIMAFVDEAIARFDFIDADRLGVTGGSYGGFMTNWIIGHTDRFKAAASQRSISNWISFSNMSDIGWYFAADQVGGNAWESHDKIWAQSPLKYADKVKTPTLFIHSDEDYRCPLPEGMQMFYALRLHGVPTRMCIFKGENHELSRSGKPKHRIRRLREITEWMEKYL